MRVFMFAAAMMFAAVTAQAETFPVVDNQAVRTECGDCHMVFPPQTLPKAVWGKIIGNLSDHFGEDASGQEPAVLAEILAYHVKNASDVSNVRAAKKWRTTAHVTRILDAPRFKAKHKGCDAVWSHKLVRSPSNCLACHKTMDTTGSTKENMSFLPANLRNVCGD